MNCDNKYYGTIYERNRGTSMGEVYLIAGLVWNNCNQYRVLRGSSALNLETWVGNVHSTSRLEWVKCTQHRDSRGSSALNIDTCVGQVHSTSRLAWVKCTQHRDLSRTSALNIETCVGQVHNILNNMMYSPNAHAIRETVAGLEADSQLSFGYFADWICGR